MSGFYEDSLLETIPDSKAGFDDSKKDKFEPCDDPYDAKVTYPSFLLYLDSFYFKKLHIIGSGGMNNWALFWGFINLF